MIDCIAVVDDLIFSRRIAGTAGQLGCTCAVAGGIEALRETLEGAAPPLVIVDLNADGFDGAEAVRTARAGRPEARLVAYVAHVDRDLADAARRAGADEVLPRSVFVKRLGELLEGAMSHRR